MIKPPNNFTRPISPHLSIYKIQISSALSIMHRLSGVVLFIGIVIMCWWFIFWVFSNFNNIYILFIKHPITKIFLFLVINSLFYHLCNGIRHLLWDSGIGFSIKFINYSGWSIIFLSITMFFCFWLVL